MKKVNLSSANETNVFVLREQFNAENIEHTSESIAVAFGEGVHVRNATKGNFALTKKHVAEAFGADMSNYKTSGKHQFATPFNTRFGCAVTLTTEGGKVRASVIGKCADKIGLTSALQCFIPTADVLDLLTTLE